MAAVAMAIASAVEVYFSLTSQSSVSKRRRGSTPHSQLGIQPPNDGLDYSVLASGFHGGPMNKESTCNAGDEGSILGSAHPLEVGTATHSSILAWRIPWTEEQGRLQSIESQRVRHD